MIFTDQVQGAAMQPVYVLTVKAIIWLPDEFVSPSGPIRKREIDPSY